MSDVTFDSAQIDALFADWDKPDSPGAALAIVHEGQAVYSRGYGRANLEYGIPISPSTVFHVASVSKQFTAFSAALLASEGKISLDAEIQAYLPELPTFSHPITVRHLIHHTSGLRDQWELLTLAGWRMDDVITQAQIMTLIGRQRELNFPPGSEYLYCNTGYTLLAEMVARICGQPFRQFMHERVFGPLGMTATHFHDDHEEIVPNRAYSYKPDGQAGFKHSVLNYANVGATSLFTTVEDLARWILHFERPTVGGSALAQQMHQTFTLTGGEVCPYAFGIRHDTHRGVKYVGHSGADAGYRTFLCRFPEQRLGIAVLSNLSTFAPQTLALKVAEAFLGARVTWGEPAPPAAPANPPAPVPVSAAELRQYAGAYYSEELDITYLVAESDGELLVTGRRRKDLRFVAVGPDSFREKEAGTLKVAFLRAGATVTGLKLQGGRVRHLHFEQIR